MAFATKFRLLGSIILILVSVVVISFAALGTLRYFSQAGALYDAGEYRFDKPATWEVSQRSFTPPGDPFGTYWQAWSDPNRDPIAVLSSTTSPDLVQQGPVAVTQAWREGLLFVGARVTAVNTSEDGKVAWFSFQAADTDLTVSVTAADGRLVAMAASPTVPSAVRNSISPP